MNPAAQTRSDKTRACEICQATTHRFLHRQYFMSAEGLRTHYDVVACSECGFVFADNIPSHEIAQAYYACSSHHQHAVQLPPGLAAIHRDFHEYIAAHVPLGPEQSVVDIGSSIGHFLTNFQTAGLRRLKGIEPSRGARRLALECYGLDVEECAIEDFVCDKPFDLVSACGVLEHIVSVQGWLDAAAKLTRIGGHLFVAVPDSGTFASSTTREPFLEFAAEHINFFTAQTLRRLIEPFGYQLHASTSLANDFYGNRYLAQIFVRTEVRASSSVEPHSRDDAGEAAVRAYIEKGAGRLASIEASFLPLIASADRCAVWGTGSLLSRLYATTRLCEANIVAFIDRHAPAAGGRHLGKPLASPSWLKTADVDVVLITSYVYRDEIHRMLRYDLGFNGNVICLPDETHK